MEFVILEIMSICSCKRIFIENVDGNMYIHTEFIHIFGTSWGPVGSQILGNINICYIVYKTFWPLSTVGNDRRGSVESSGRHCESQCKSCVRLVQRW